MVGRDEGRTGQVRRVVSVGLWSGGVRCVLVGSGPAGQVTAVVESYVRVV